MTHIAFARKYRPQSFEELIGQPHVTETLTRAITAERIGQAYLFAGQRGVGKTSAARILAKCLNCEHGPKPKPCNACSSCTQITEGRSLDVIEIDGASNRGIDEIRSLRDTVAFAPTSGSFRVYIIDEVHMLTAEAFNALLKTLEEPPAHVRFVFATTAAHKIPATILSRCQRFDFRSMTHTAIVDALARLAKSESLTIDEAARYAIARAADGSLRDAEVILEQLASFVDGPVHEDDVTALLGVMASEALADWTQALLRRDAPQALVHLTRQRDQGRDPTQLLTGLVTHVRNLLIVRSTPPDASRQATLARLIDEPPERLAKFEQWAEPFSPQELLMVLQVLASAYELVRRSPMAQTMLEMVVVKLATREHWQSLDEISQRLTALGTGSAPGAGQPPIPMRSAAMPPSATPAATPQGVPPPSPAAPIAGAAPESFATLWPTFLERLGSQKMSLAAYLADARPLRLVDDTLTVGVPSSALHQEVLNAAEHRRLIERLLSELAHTPLHIQYEILPAAAAAASGAPEAPSGESERPIVQDIVELFNATILGKPQPPAS